jgi:hypothetical protein
MKVYYYDDSEAHIADFKREHPSVKSILVRNADPNPILKGMDSFYYPTMFVRKYPHNKYAQALMLNHDILHPKKTHPDEVCANCRSVFMSGLTIPEIRRIAKRKADAVLFDWDFTLSSANGLGGHNIEAGTYTEMAQYFAGTMERFKALREMFTELRRRGTKIFILSDNGLAQESRAQELLDIARILDSELAVEDIVYGNGEKAKVFAADKRFQPFRTSRKTRKRKR